MSTTTLTPRAQNLHQPASTENRITCAAPDCGYSMHTHSIRMFEGKPDQLATYWESLFDRHHADQYAPGRAPDITVDWEISACCSVCEDGVGKVVTNDSETVTCEECDTTWCIDGTAGELKDVDA
jgi:hypothetical protein